MHSLRAAMVSAITLAALSVLLDAHPEAVHQEPTLPQVLGRSAVYVTRLHRQLAGIVAEETYVQRSVVSASGVTRASRIVRTLKSDLLLIRLPGRIDYVEFRDVFDVDGKPVRDRQERLSKLFIKPSATGAVQLQQIIDEGARYNVGNILRSINTPLLALAFLTPEMQSGVEFRQAKREQPKPNSNPALPNLKLNAFAVAPEVWTVEFKETSRPTLIKRRNGGDFAANGRFWIDVTTGAVLVSELLMRSTFLNADINVSYQSEPLLGFRVPVAMDERHRTARETVDAVATYGRFRQFQVTTDVLMKPPGR
jgi:hypothetical protein